jgi:hypothetical protein
LQQTWRPAKHEAVSPVVASLITGHEPRLVGCDVAVGSLHAVNITKSCCLHLRTQHPCLQTPVGCSLAQHPTVGNLVQRACQHCGSVKGAMRQRTHAALVVLLNGGTGKVTVAAQCTPSRCHKSQPTRCLRPSHPSQRFFRHVPASATTL